jgi:hypothetical protein
MDAMEKDGRVWNVIMCQKTRLMVESCRNVDEEHKELKHKPCPMVLISVKIN